MTEDTAARSLAHWSEEGRGEMEDFYALAGEDYRQLALAADWPQVLASHAREGWRLLDVACGSGKWPSALLRFAGIGSAGLPDVDYDLLDPSPFSIAEAKAQLAGPWVARRELTVGVEDLPADAEGYDVVWATHALYALPPEVLVEGAARMWGALRPGGLGFVAQAGAHSHYLVMYDAYRQGITEATPYTSVEQVAEALGGAGADVRTQWITYTSGSSDRSVVEGFLRRCAFDDTVTLEQMESAPVLGDYLAGCRRPDGSYVFDHEVGLLWF